MSTGHPLSFWFLPMGHSNVPAVRPTVRTVCTVPSVALITAGQFAIVDACMVTVGASRWYFCPKATKFSTSVSISKGQ